MQLVSHVQEEVNKDSPFREDSAEIFVVIIICGMGKNVLSLIGDGIPFVMLRPRVGPLRQPIYTHLGPFGLDPRYAHLAQVYKAPKTLNQTHTLISLPLSKDPLLFCPLSFLQPN